MLSVRIWGCRGSIPCPGPSTVEFGGNTSCLEIRADARLIIVDMGTGIRLLGDWLLENDLRSASIDTDIFVTHTHWDHIMGFPLFAPLFSSATKLRIHGPVSYENDTLESIIGTQLSYRYWPVRLSDLAAHIEYDQIGETTLNLGEGLRVTAKYLNHPVLCLGYRFEYRGKSIVTAYDTEPFRNVFPTNPEDPGYDEYTAREGERAAREANEKIFRFMQNADVLIHDSQYTAGEYGTDKVGWGHSSYEYAIAAAQKTGVRKLVLFHHDPHRTDRQLAAFETEFREMVKTGPDIIMAREGLTVEA
jgi:ribonuclease BN (tRNA processing enzyme)